VTFGPIDPGDRVRMARALLNLQGAELVAVVEKAEAIRRHRLVDVDLRADIERLLPLVTPEHVRDEIRDALDEVHPAYVLREWWEPMLAARQLERSKSEGASRVA
jgi:hypothetical protein